MALSLDQISAITSSKWIPKLVDNIFDSDVLLQRLKKKSYVKLDGGENIIQPLNYAQNGAGDWYSGSQTLSNTDVENITGAQYEWKQLYESISITGRDKLMNAGDSQKVNFVKSKVMIAEKSMKDRLSTGLYSDGSTAASIIGLRDIVATDQTVGGISQTDYSWWAAQVDASTTTLTMAALQSVYTNCCINEEHPTLAIATRANYNRYYALLQPQQRFTDSESAKGGFSSLMFNGIPFVVGSKVPTSHVFFLNESYLHLYVHKERDFKFENFAKPVDQDVEVAHIFWMGAFGSSNNRMHGKLSAIAA